MVHTSFMREYFVKQMSCINFGRRTKLIDIVDKIKGIIFTTLAGPYIIKLSWMLVSVVFGGFCEFFEPGSFKVGYDAWMSLGMGYLEFIDSITWVL